MKAEPELSGMATEAATVGIDLPLVATLKSLETPFLESIGQPAFVDVFQQIINGLPEQIALLDESWNILAVNDAWTRTAALYGYFALCPGTNYYEILREKATEGHSSAGIVVDGIRTMEER